MTNRIVRLSAWLGPLTGLAMIGLVLLAGVLLWSPQLAPIGLDLPEGYTPSIAARRLALSVSLLQMIPLVWALDHLRRLFAGYRRGAVLTADAARHIRKVGLGLMLTALLRLLAQPLSAIALTAAAPPGSRMLVLGLSSNELGLLLAAGVMAVIGLAMEDAAKAAEENRGFV